VVFRKYVNIALHCILNQRKIQRGASCYDGKIKLPPTTIPEELKQLFTSTDGKSKNFRENIRQYNNAMSFVLFGAKVDLPPNYDLYTFRIYGMVHHRISPLYPKDLQSTSYD